MNLNQYQRQKTRMLIGAVQRIQNALRSEVDRRHTLIEIQRGLQQKLNLAHESLKDQESNLSKAHRHEWPDDIDKQRRHIAALNNEMQFVESEGAEINKNIEEVTAYLADLQPVAESLMKRIDRDDPVRQLNADVRGDHIVMTRR